MLRPQFDIASHPLFDDGFVKVCHRYAEWFIATTDGELDSDSLFFRIVRAPNGGYKVTPMWYSDSFNESSFIVLKSAYRFEPNDGEMFIFSASDISHAAERRVIRTGDELKVYWGYEPQSFFGINAEDASDSIEFDHVNPFMPTLLKARQLFTTMHGALIGLDVDKIGITLEDLKLVGEDFGNNGV